MDAVILLASVLALAEPGEPSASAHLDLTETRAAAVDPGVSQPNVRSDTGDPKATGLSGAPPVPSRIESHGSDRSSLSIDENRPVGRATSPLNANKPLRRSVGGQSEFSIWPGLLALGGVLALIVMLTMLVKRFAPRVGHMSAGQIEIVGRSFVSSKQSVALVRVGDRIVVVGICPESMSPLLVIDDPVEVGRLSVRTRGGQAAFDRLVAEEAVSFAATDAPAEIPRPRTGLNQLLASVRARVQQI